MVLEESLSGEKSECAQHLKLCLSPAQRSKIGGLDLVLLFGKAQLEILLEDDRCWIADCPASFLHASQLL